MKTSITSSLSFLRSSEGFLPHGHSNKGSPKWPAHLLKASANDSNPSATVEAWWSVVFGWEDSSWSSSKSQLTHLKLNQIPFEAFHTVLLHSLLGTVNDAGIFRVSLPEQWSFFRYCSGYKWLSQYFMQGFVKGWVPVLSMEMKLFHLRSDDQFGFKLCNDVRFKFSLHYGELMSQNNHQGEGLESQQPGTPNL